MGIPHYFHTITKTYKNVILYSKPSVEFDHFFIDFNGIIHTAANKIEEKTDESIFEKTWMLTTEAVNIIKPKKMIHICADGVAPVAKMNQQRKRRYLSIFRQTLILNKDNGNDKSQEILWDRNCISPGTNFSKKLNLYIHNCIRNNDTKYIYNFDSSDQPGEGEHKIFSRIANLSEDSDNLNTSVIHGLDADLIMLSLISHKKNIYLMRENDKSYNEFDKFIYLNIHELRIGILKELQSNYIWTITDDTLLDPYSYIAKNIIESYIVLCFFLGNDFLPHIPSLSLKNKGHERILTIAKKIQFDNPESNGYIVNHITNTINIEMIVKILIELTKDENQIIKQLNEEYIAKHPFQGSDQIESYPIQKENKSNLSKLLLEKKNKWRSYYYKELFDSKLHDSKIVIIASKSFIQGIFWTYAYYKRKPELMIDVHYYYPYEYSPTILDLSNYLQSSFNNWKNIPILEKKITDELFVSPNVQLLCILPSISLPDHLQKYAIDSKYGLKHMFPKNYKIHTYLKTQLWECSPILPQLDIEYIKNCIK